MGARKKVTTRDIAQMCNVSAATVSRIMNGTGSFSEETKRLVFETMRREGYAMDNIETRPASPIVGVLVPNCDNEFFSSLISHINKHLAEKKICVMICESSFDPKREAECLQQFYQIGAIGVILIGCHIWALADAISETIPTILTDSTFDLANFQDYYVVTSDHFVGGQMAAQELLRKGCKKPIIMSNRSSEYEHNARIQGFIQDFASQGIEVPTDSVYQMDLLKSSFIAAEDLVSYLWTKGVDFDSIFACNDWRAYGSLIGLKSMGVKVPEEVKIVGYDGIRVSQYCDMPFTTVQQNTSLLAQNTCDMLWNLINNEPVEKKHVLIPIRLQEGQTT